MQSWHHRWAAEVYRVLKPGAHLLAFGGTRTYHRLVCAIEDAGFEIRDTIAWVYGSGFPKSLDVSKAIDKQGGPNARFDEVRAWLRERVKQCKLRYRDIDAALGNVNSHKASHYLDNSQPQIPTPADWAILKQLLGVSEDIEHPAKFLEYEREVIGYRKAQRGVAFTSDGPSELPITVPATPEAAQWSGWGTALKPAMELICVARKPLSEKTVAANVLRWGTGAVNVDGCRVEGTKGSGVWGTSNKDCQSGRTFNASPGGEEYRTSPHPSGRWPANLVLDEEAGRQMDEVVGERHRGRFPDRQNIEPGGYTIYGNGWSGKVAPERNLDTGGPSRFFYCAKASRKEREAGCEENHHPTVKPLALMRWLCRLVTPPGGVVLDPFAGSGSTLIAAGQEGFRFLGCEREEEYVRIAEARLAHWLEQPVLAMGGAA